MRYDHFLIAERHKSKHEAMEPSITVYNPQLRE
jgi:hypothetical protein